MCRRGVGGLPVTRLLPVLSRDLGFPFAVLLALGRRSPLPVLRWVSTGTIEILLGLPLIGLLFVASIHLPPLPSPRADDRQARPHDRGAAGNVPHRSDRLDVPLEPAERGKQHGN